VTSTTFRTTVLATATLAVLVLVAAALAWWLADAERWKQRLTAGLGDSLAMQVTIDGPLRFGLWPGPQIILGNVRMSRDGQTVATAERASARLALRALLFGNVRLRELHVEQPELWIERYQPGAYNFRDPKAETAELSALSLRRLTLSDARLNYVDRASDLEWSVEHCDLDLRDLRHSGGQFRKAMASLAANGEVTCRSLRQDQFVVTELVAQLRGTDGVFALEPVTASIFEGHVSGSVEADYSSATPVYTLQSSLAGFDMSAYMTQLEPDQETAGKIDLEMNLSVRGTSWQEIRNSAAGSLSLNAAHLTIHGYDLDDELDDYAATQRFNLVDVGAVFLAGPLGLAVTRGHKFAGLLRGSKGRTEIEQMVSEWIVEDGVARAHDVAFRTPQHRIALTGALDFGEYQFLDMRVAVIDVHGCAIIVQRLSGHFREPRLEQPNVLVTVIGPLINLVKRGVKEITDKDCKAFYSGSMPHPE
jgi:uncharacterized protein involved in outer membrane biogenesis